MAQPKITIQFDAKGDQVVVKAIEKLDKATKALIKVQEKLAGEGQKQVKSQNRNKGAIDKVNVSLALQGSNWKKAGISAKLYTQAVKGNKLALAKVQVATKKHIESLQRQKKGLLETQHSTRILGGSFAVLRSKMLLASFAGSIFASTIGKLANLMGEQEKAEKRLETALGRRSQSLLAFASAQQQVTTFGDEETITAMSLVGAYTENEKAIARLTQASMDLSVAKGMDLKSATDLVTKSVFSSTNALSRYGIVVEGSAGSTQRLESATSTIAELYGGQAQENAQTFLGSLQQLGNSAGDLGERFGSIFVPAITLSAQGLKRFAESIDTEEIKAYGTAVVGVGSAWLIFTKGAIIAQKAMLLLNKVSKKNIMVFGAMVTIGAVIDKFNFFKDSTSDLSGELDKLAGDLENLNAKGGESIAINERLAMSEFKKGEAYRLNADVFAEQRLLDEERRLTLERFNITNEDYINGQVKDKEAIIAMNEIEVRNIQLSEKKRETKNKLISETIGSFGQLNSAMKGSAVVSKRLAQGQAIIDTYAAANKALRTGTPPWSYAVMASVIATGLANVATIEAQKFAKGGDFITNKPELIMVGEAGREHVQITPIDRPEERAMKHSEININIQGGVVDQDYVTNTLIPAINASGQRVA